MRQLTRNIVILSCAILPMGAMAQKPVESFDQFRKSILASYNDYRNEALSQYAKYLDSIWVEYPQHAGLERNPIPKPKDIPKAEEKKPKSEDKVPPTPDRQPDAGSTPMVTPIDKPDIPPPPAPKGEICLSFYGMPLTMEDEAYAIPDRLTRRNSSDLWRYMYESGADKRVIAEIRRVADEMNLNDYFIYELTRSYVETKFGDRTPFTRDVLIHFLLCNMGYDVRFAETASGTSLILMPCNQTVFGHTYIIIDGKNYYVFGDRSLSQGEAIYTCYLPSDFQLGKSFEMQLGELRLPYKPQQFCVEYDGITLRGEINANLYPMLYHYPQMPIGDYAASVVDGKLRQTIVSQMSEALKDNGRRDKVERMLHFTQSAFEYATDKENHGFEKPYFFEEMLFYPKSDCEDRAIFYSYLLYRVAGVENHLISYPGHECVSVTMPSEAIEGTSYDYEGKVFFISDPTYIGATTGMCMPQYRSMKPNIDYIYK